MKSLIMWALLILLPYLTMAQCDCQVDSVPCYVAIKNDLGIKATADRSARQNVRWKEYESKMRSAYGKGCRGEFMFNLGNKGSEYRSETLIDTRPDAPFLIAEKYTWVWGGVFYFIDLDAATQSRYRELTGLD